VVDHKAKLCGYNERVWFSKQAITNVMALSNVIKQYRVTYDSDELTFVVHCKMAGKPNMHFRMHESGLHCYDLRDYSTFAFVETVSGNLQGFTK